MKTCTCCKKTISASEWPRLPYVGVQSVAGVPRLELRNHPVCGSTLAIEIPHTAPVAATGVQL